jgi:cell volume regulation protein A
LINSNEILLLISGIIILGFIGEIAFRRRRVPDMLILMLIGILIHYSGIIPRVYISSLEQFLGLFGIIALTLIVFGGVLKIDIGRYGKAVSRGIVIAILDIVFVMGILTPLLYYFFKIPFIDSLLLSGVLSETSATFIISLLSRLKIDEVVNHAIQIETIFNSVLNIIAVLLILNVIGKNSSYIGIAGYLFSTVSEGIILGGVVGIVWLIALKQATVPHYYMATVGVIFMLWAVSDYFNASPILSVFIFSIIIANSVPLSKIMKISGSVDTEKLLTFNDEISFFVLTFFYVYIGIFVNIFDVPAFIIALIIVLVLVGIRFGEIYSIDIATKWIGNYRKLIGSMAQRGSTVIVLLGVLLSVDPILFSSYANVIFFVVILSILFSSTFYSITSRKFEIKKE